MDSLTEWQISKLRLDRAKPLIICDVDEVVVHFLKGLEAFLDQQELWLDPASFALNGNIREKDTNDPIPGAQIGGLIERFFSEWTGNLDAIDGASASLAALSEHADIVMLTNMPDAYKPERIRNLASHGMDYPVVSNAGPKGPSVHHMSQMTSGPVVFIDDTPSNVNSVTRHAPEVHVMHFMQDHRFRVHLPDLQGIIGSVDNWSDGSRLIMDAVQGPA
ncbi:MAG: hypothetical protein AAF441_15710 [Pseudomonadota bacterium]